MLIKKDAGLMQLSERGGTCRTTREPKASSQRNASCTRLQGKHELTRAATDKYTDTEGLAHKKKLAAGQLSERQEIQFKRGTLRIPLGVTRFQRIRKKINAPE